VKLLSVSKGQGHLFVWVARNIQGMLNWVSAESGGTCLQVAICDFGETGQL